jgi:hypothetical protein
MGRRLDNSDRGGLITVEAVRRLARAAQRIENGGRNIKAPPLRTAFDEGSGDPVRLGRTTEKWAKGTTTELELIFEDSCEDEGLGSGAETIEAHNLSQDVAEGVQCVVALAANGCWYLVEAGGCDEGSGSGSGECECLTLAGQDLTTIAGYDAEATQVLGHEAGCLTWISTTQCTEEAS